MSEGLAWPPRKEDLQRLYLEQKLSAARIAHVYGLKSGNPKSAETLILHHLRKFGIARRDRAQHIRKVTEEMVQEWIDRYGAGQSLKQIAGKRFDPVTVYYHLKRRGVQLRDKVEAQVRRVSKYEKHPFVGSNLERGYLLGLRYGDLHAVRHGRAIRVRVSTTHPAMANLFESLFSPYGHVHRYPRAARLTGYEWSLECDLDSSFEFLLRKTAIKEIDSMPDLQFESFLAGFFDAEGSIYFHRKKYPNFEISITNTSKDVLKVIQRFLIRKGYHPRLEHHLQDSERFETGVAGDCWRLCICRRNEISRLLNRLSLRREEKVAKTRLALGYIAGELIIKREGSPEGWVEHLDKVTRDCGDFVVEASEIVRGRSEEVSSKERLGSNYLSASTGQ